MIDLKIGEAVEGGVKWLSINGAFFFDAIAWVVEAFIKFWQSLLIPLPHWLVIIFLSVLVHYLKTGRKKFFQKSSLKKSWGMILFIIFGLLLIQSMGFWDETIKTLILVISSALLALLIGLPLGILSARYDNFYAVVRPILDFMQTMPAFVYLIPAILFFNVGNVPGVVATVVFALPPAVRLTNLGIRNVPADVVEASHAFGASPGQLLYKVQLPLAMPTIMAGVNQVIMLSLSMVVIASMVGAGGLGQSVYKGILQAKVGLGFEAGLAIVVLAIILDRLTALLQKGKQ